MTDRNDKREENASTANASDFVDAQFEELGSSEEAAVDSANADHDESKLADEKSASESDEVDEFDDDLESEDSLTFSNGVIEKIVAIAMRDVPGVVGMKGGWINRLQDAFGASDARKGVTVEVTPESAVRVNISVLIEYGSYAPQVFEDVKRAVVKQVTGMTGLEVAGVNLRIEDVLTAEEIAARSGDAERELEASFEKLIEAPAETPADVIAPEDVIAAVPTNEDDEQETASPLVKE